MHSALERARERAAALYERHGKYLPLVFFVSGFIWDSLTLTRVDNLVDNLILLAYLLLLGLLIVLLNMTGEDTVRTPLLEKYRRFYPLGIQFFLGGLFSSYVVFYFQSASWSKTSLFLLVLVFLLVGNEFLENRLSNIHLQMSLFFMTTFSYFIFFIPVAFKVMNYGTFLASGILSLSFSGGIMYLFLRKGVFPRRGRLWVSASIVAVLFLFLNSFYLKNWIPPVPLSLKYGGIFHNVTREGDAYALTFRKPHWYSFWVRSDDPFLYEEDDRVHCFTAIFAPLELRKAVYHHWQKYDPEKKKWATTDKLEFEITGGREKGYRGYTYKSHTSPGRWRVEVKTADELLLGRVDFIIKPVAKGSGARARFGTIER
jgi:hypothetical protein